MTYLLPPTVGRLVVTVQPPQRPVKFVWQKHVHLVARVVNEWRVEDGWWHRPIARHYYQVMTSTGWLAILYWDRIEDAWYLERLHD